VLKASPKDPIMEPRRNFLPRSVAVAGIVLRCATLALPGVAIGQSAAPGAGLDNAALAAHHQRKTLQERLSALGTALQLNATQAALWQAYVDAAVQQSEARRQWQQANPRPAVLTLPQKIDRRMAMSRQLQPGRERADLAMKRVYAGLSPTQQLTLELALAHGRGGHRASWSAG
jgi:hypothetical protein